MIFHNALQIQDDPKQEHKFVLITPFIVHYRKKTIVIPAGFWTDFASVPRMFWSILPPFGEYTRAAVLHDFLYYAQNINGLPITRAWADKAFLDGMKYLGVNWITRYTMYSAVRMGGIFAWNKYKKDRSKNED